MSIHDDLKVQKFRSPYYKTIVNIMYTGHWLTATMNTILKPLGLTEPQYNVITQAYIAKGRPISSSEIGEGMIQKESNVTRIVDRLVDRGWISRNTCPENRRKVDIAITEEGRRVFIEARNLVMAFHSNLEKALESEDLNHVSDLLDELRRLPESGISVEK